MNLTDATTAAMTAWFDSGVSTTVTYNGVAIPGHVTYGGKNDSIASHAVLTVRVSDVAAPAYRDSVVINGQTWRVFQDKSVVISGDGMTWAIPIMYGERAAI